MIDETPRQLEHIEADVKSHIVCTNLNRVCILHLLKKTPKNEMQAEEMSYRLGISHRTVLYHLDILHDYGLVEVRKFRKKGNKLMRSIWGLKGSSRHLKSVFKKISCNFEAAILDEKVCRNAIHQ
jgi:DNA-binding transcriptional ArsR family regulator